MVTPQFRKAVLAYRYSSPNLSFLEWLCLNQFWERITLLYPMWLAPNIITLMGFLCIVVAFAFNLSTSLEGLGTMPDHLYPCLAALVFIYQTLDGSDGKQARRTKSGSALGELMDHGVDAVTTGLISSFLCDAFGFGVRSPWPWVLLFGAQVGFYLSNLTLLHAGTQTFFQVDVMELQWVIIGALTVTGVAGQAIWTSIFPGTDMILASLVSADATLAANVSTGFGAFDSYPGTPDNNDLIDLSAGLQVRVVIGFCGFVGTWMNVFSYLMRAVAPYCKSHAKRPQHIKDGATGTGLFSLLHQLAGIIGYVALAMLSWWEIREDTSLVGADETGAFRALHIVCCFGFADIMNRVLIMRVAHTSTPFVPAGLMAVALIYASFVVRRSEELVGAAVVEAVTKLPVWWFWVPAVLMTLTHLRYFVQSSGDLATVLKIHPFKVASDKKKKSI